MQTHEEWTSRLSDYLDGELPSAERAAVDAHLRDCPACATVLDDLKRVVVHARGLVPRPPRTDLWGGVAVRLERVAQPRRVTFTVPQLAAAAVLLMAISGTVAVKLIAPVAEPSSTARPPTSAGPVTSALSSQLPLVDVESVSLGDAQYDAAVADLEKALTQGRGRLDASTIAVVEHNLQIIDQAIAQAREALAADTANTYLSGHLVEARRRKLDLLRRAAELAETN